jgi:large subunit ribosomal protein L10
MPNAKVLSEKQKIVADLTEKIKAAQAGVLVDYTGITVAEDTEMRRKLRAENVEDSVIKNTLLRFAVNNVGMEALDDVLNGTTSLAISTEDPIAPARIIKEHADKFNDHFVIKGGFMDGKVLSIDEVKALAAIPALPVLRAQVLGTMLAPITSLAVVLKAYAEKLGAPAEEVPAE